MYPFLRPPVSLRRAPRLAPRPRGPCPRITFVRRTNFRRSAHAPTLSLLPSPGRQPEQMERLPCAARYRAVARAGLWNRPASGDEAEAGPNRPASGDEAEAGSSAGAGECRASPLCAV